MPRFPSLARLLTGSCAALLAAIQPVSAQTPATDAPPGWTLVWSDEFDGTAIDETKWSFDLDCWGGGNEERQCYTARPENASVADGLLRITARRENAVGPALPPHLDALEPEDKRGKLAAKPFTSARLSTKGKGDWTYGRFEIRARPPTGQGTWSAAWMLPTDEVYGPWALSGEIDIMELVNQGTACKECKSRIEDRVIGTIHFGGEWPRNKYKGEHATLPPSTDGFHIYAVEWEQGEIRWYVDGQNYLTLNQKDWKAKALFSKMPESAPFDQRFHMLLNLAIGGNLAESTNEGGVDLTGFPKTLEIDWVRVYAPASGTGN
jgi:beta-glucanase (GH16 family)